jgi:hypothetical protein
VSSESDLSLVQCESAVCIAEDRQSCEPAVMILIASLFVHCPGVTVELFAPNASDDLKTWLSGYAGVHLNPGRVAEDLAKYDIKPRALLTLLERGYAQVLWVDSDILICRDFRPLFAELDTSVLALAEEALCSSHGDPNGLRARLAGLKVGRTLPFATNTAVMRVTPDHVALLRRWEELLKAPAYREAQARAWQLRPLHLLGDQDVLTAILAGEEFARTPLSFLRRGIAIIQYFGSSGYTAPERLRNLLLGMPPFVHSQGFRPWWERADRPRTLAAGFKALYEDLSPYTLLACAYRNSLPETQWMTPAGLAPRIFRALAFGQAPLVGLPLAVIADAVRLVKRAIAKMRPEENQTREAYAAR